MQTQFKAVKVTDTVYWVGAIDWNTRDFHGYSTHRGTTYNAYLIMADKITLVDTVKGPFFNEMMSRIASVVDPADISIIISNHAEPDHSGNLPAAIECIKPETVYTSVMGEKALNAHFHDGLPLTAVKTGDTVSLGNREITFIETRMLHWPDSMFSYLADEQVLFSNDAFGMHLASTKRFADEIDPSVLKYEAEKYYANIILPYSARVTALLDQVEQNGPPVQMMLTDHGPIWRRPEDIGNIMACYRAWAAQKPLKKAVIVYDTMWMSTDKMAHAMAEGIADSGVEVVVRSMKATHRSDIAKDLLDCGAVAVGSPTINNNMFPTLAEVLSYLKGLKPLNKVGTVFGSYGWSGEAARQIAAILDDMKIEQVGEPIRAQYVPDNDVLDQCYARGEELAKRLIEKCDS